MNTRQKRHNLIEMLSTTEDELLLNQIKAILEGSNVSIWDDLNPRLKESIDRGLEQSKRGLGVAHDEVMKDFRARLPK